MDLLRLLTCGSVDDGKSTLIGRLLHDSQALYDDHLVSLARDSERTGSAGGGLDFALLLDGLKAEREQGITIDVAYRYFSTPRRRFIIADCPGHVQYTRNMVTGASTADLAVLLVDATRGVLEQTRRHAFLVSLLEIGHVVLAINKMDRVEYAESVYERIRQEFTDFAARLQIGQLHFIPLSALRGDNVVRPGERMPWFRGQPLLEYLETVHIASDRNLIDLRFPVQYVIRPDDGFRGYAGTVASGILRPGAEVLALPSGGRTRIAAVLGPDGPLEQAFPPQAVTVTLADELDVGRGELLVHPRNQPRTGDRLEAVLAWLGDAPLVPDRPYLIKHCTRLLKGSVCDLRYRFDITHLHREPATTLALNEIGRVGLALDSELAHDPYARNRTTGSLILIDPGTHHTVGAAMILDRVEQEVEPREPALQVHEQRGAVTAEERRARLAQRPVTLWLTGLPRSGKTTLAYRIERKLFDAGHTAHVLDGENLRLGLSQDLGFGALDRSENIRRAAQIARLCNDAGLVTLVALVSPFEADRLAAREIVGPARFRLIHLSAPLDACEARDTTGLYAQARQGQLGRFTGVSAPYEAPAAPDLVLPTHELSIEQCVARLVEHLAAQALLEP